MILGLQNDVLGFDKDFASGNPLSALQLLIWDGMNGKKALLRLVNHHNQLVTEMIREAEELDGADAAKDYVSAAATWPHAMAVWMISCERYKVTA